MTANTCVVTHVNTLHRLIHTCTLVHHQSSQLQPAFIRKCQQQERETWSQQQLLIDNIKMGFFDVTTNHKVVCKCKHEYHYRDRKMETDRVAHFCRICSAVHTSPTVHTSRLLDFNTNGCYSQTQSNEANHFDAYTFGHSSATSDCSCCQ